MERQTRRDRRTAPLQLDQEYNVPLALNRKVQHCFVCYKVIHQEAEMRPSRPEEYEAQGQGGKQEEIWKEFVLI